MPNLLAATITTAVSAQAVGNTLKFYEGSPRNLTIQANFTYGSGGTSADAYVQSTVDGGATWTDLCNFHFTTASLRKMFNLSSLTPVTTQATPTSGSISANTSVDGLIGTQIRILLTTVGTYAGGTTLAIDVATARATFTGFNG
jgi:hypothetical protein